MKYLRAAFRFILFLTATLGLYSIWFVGAFFIPNKIFWRQFILKNWARSFVKISKMKFEIIGTPPQPPFFLVSNHLSYTDIPAFRAVCDTIFVAKADIEKWFLAGRIVRDMGAIFINRENRRDIPRAGAQIIERLENGEGVLVFPEGTSTKGEEVLPFNSSFMEFAAKNDLPVYYASISYETPPDETNASDAVCWWRDVSFMAQLWELFQVREYTAVINFGDEPVKNDNRKQLARELHEKVREKFVPVI